MENRYKGITLIELVIYLSLFTLVVMVIVQFFAMVVDKNVHAERMLEQSRNELYISQTINQLSEKLNSINFNNSIAGNDNGKIVFQSGGDNVEIFLQNNVLYLRESNVDYRLSVPQVIVEKFLLETLRNQANEIIGYNITLNLRHNLLNNSVESYQYVFAVN